MVRNWTCSYCGQPTTITGPNYSAGHHKIGTEESKYGKIYLSVIAIACPNPDCKELDLRAFLLKEKSTVGRSKLLPPNDTLISRFSLMPRSKAKPQPDYIPEAIRSDYKEACLIVNDSPKAAAALARRCLQGIVRDYWELPPNKRGKLGAELNQIKDKVSADSWSAIQAVRSVGDIGAHMEKDVDLIIDVEPEEAELLLELIETLFLDWYVESHKRGQRNNRLVNIAESKLAKRKEAASNRRQCTGTNSQDSVRSTSQIPEE